MDFLVHMEFCCDITEEDLFQLVTETLTEYGFLPETCFNKKGVMLHIQIQSMESKLDHNQQRSAAPRTEWISFYIPDNFTEHKSLTQIGVVPFSKICTAFAKLNETKENDPKIVDFLVHMEFLWEITEEYLIQLVFETHTEYSSALTQQSPPQDL